MRVGIIGFGSIGRRLAEALLAHEAGAARLHAVLTTDRSVTRAAEVCVPAGCTVTSDPESFFAVPLDLVVEAAGQGLVAQYGLRVLQRQMDLMVCSVGALADDELRESLAAAAAESGRRVLVPAGAIIGLDGIGAAALGRIDEILHIVRKPPAAWKGTAAERQVDLDAIAVPTVLYEGSPREGARLYPANVNVPTAVALAGIGLDRTKIRVVADPTITQNVHDLSVKGEFGEFSLTVQSHPTENPKTGILTTLAVINAVRRLSRPLLIGV